ncbi:hypothetical protein Droror1_Dr00014909 [Drosera rotundifolia]
MAAKKRRRNEDIIAVDRLSDLPDEVLGHILSFLPTKKAVQTSVLSKRWKGVFSLATGLEFNCCHDATAFINFVDRVLSLHKVSIRRFKLNVSIRRSKLNFRSMDQSDVSCVDAWIASALSLRAQELDLELRYQMDDMTQHKLLNSCTMTVLKLGYNYDHAILKVPMSVCLSSLRVLHLHRIIFPDVNSTSRFFLGCSSLTDLTLSSCEWMDGQVYSVSCPKLRNLTIYDQGYHNYTKNPTIELDLPGAQQLDLELRYQMDDMMQHKLLNLCTMTVLKLKCYYDAILKVPMSVCLSSLRVLHLQRIIFPDVNSTSRFFLGCSSLTDLTLSSCEWMDCQVYSVSCAKLRNLTIDDPGYHDYAKTPTIVLDLPGAQQLDLELGYQMDDMMQHKLLNLCTMTVLKLKYYYDHAILKVPMSVCLSSLRVLHLQGIIFPDVNSTSRFFLGCSSLADLTLSSCEWMDGQVYSVSCAKLRNLTIDDPGYHNYTKTPTIELDLPVVVYFKCCSIPQQLFHIKNLDVIHTAELRFSSSCDKADLCFIRLMRQLSNVKVLRLFGDSLTVLSRIKLSKLPTTFVNLTRLEVGSSYGENRKGWRRLPKLIARSPLLETLVFKEGLEACYSDLVVFLDDQREPISKNHITIQVDGYWGRKKEYKLMKLFLRSDAFNLKQLVVNDGRYRRYRTV